MFKFVIKRLSKIKWLATCLIIGCSLAVAVLSSVPVYRDAILQRMLTKDLEKIYTEEELYPGVVKLDSSVYVGNSDSGKTASDNYDLYKTTFHKTMEEKLNLPIASNYERVTYSYLKGFRNGSKDGYETKLIAQDTLPDHVKMVAGRMFSTEKTEDGVIEVIATQQALYESKMVMGADYTLKAQNKNVPGDIKIRIVGIFTMADGDTTYWQEGLGDFAEGVVGPYELLSGDFIKGYTNIFTGLVLCNNYDYKEMKIGDVDRIISGLDSIENVFKWAGKIVDPCKSVLSSYPQRKSDISLTLLLLQVPLVLILIFYIFMVAKLTVQHDESEISVLKSRGGSKMQIFKIYLIEGTLLGVISVVIGIPLGMLLCKVLGFSNGFLEFVHRKAMTLEFSWQSGAFAVIAVLVFLITMLIPAYIASKTEIVMLKARRGQQLKASVWERLGIDFILLAASLYGLFNYNSRQQVILQTGTGTDSVPLDPLMFVMSTAFILGLGLLFLRIYPFIMRFFFKLGEKRWGASVYASLINVSRSRGQDRFIMLFLIFSLSIGIFNATAARTLNRNEEEKASYASGADLVLGFQWVTVDGSYMEPNMGTVNSIEGVVDSTKVIHQTSNTVYKNVRKAATDADIFGIDPKAFADVAWWREDILEQPLTYYTDYLTSNKDSCFISSTFLDLDKSIQVGDNICIKINNQVVKLKVAGFMDYFPTFYPTNQNGKAQYMVLVDQNKLRYNIDTFLFYDVWAKTDGETSSADIYQSIRDLGLRLISLTDRQQKIIASRNDAMLQSVNGALTMGFVMTMLVSAIGFLIFWILSIKNRMLQFGILRSMGMSKGGVIGMLVWDQIFVSGSAILVGTGIGALVAKLFVPILQVSANAASQVPPFIMEINQSDYVKIFTVVGVIVIAGLVALGSIINRMDINQTLKLGED